jgi:hypothetical protein
VSAIKRLDRRPQVDRSGELLESNTPELNEELEQPPVEAILALRNQFFQDRFDPANEQQALGGIDGAGKRSPAELALFDKVLTTEDFQQRLEETLNGTSERAQQAKQIESAYEVYFKDTEDFPAENIPLMDSVGGSRAVTSPELPRYEAPAEAAWKDRANTVPEFPAVTLPEAASEQQAAAQASAAVQASQSADELAEGPLSVLGRSPVRA